MLQQEVMSVTNHTMFLWRDAAFCNNGALLGSEWMCSDYDSAGFVYKIKRRLLTQRFAISAAENITTHADMHRHF